METKQQEILQQQKLNIKQKRYRKAILQIQKTIQKLELFSSSFIFDILGLQQKALAKLLNKNMFKKNPYSVYKIGLIIGLINRNVSVQLYIVEIMIKNNSNHFLKQQIECIVVNKDVKVLVNKILTFEQEKELIEPFFESFFMVIIPCINTLKRYQSYHEAYLASKCCYQLVNKFKFENNMTLIKKVIEVKMIYSCILFELEQYQQVRNIEMQIIDHIMNTICSDCFIRLKQTNEKKNLGQNLWRKLLVSLMVNLSSSIHEKNYHSIIDFYKLFASAVNYVSRVQNIRFKSCISYVLDSVGAILKQYIEVMNQTKQFVEELFPLLVKITSEKNKNQQQSFDTIQGCYYFQGTQAQKSFDDKKQKQQSIINCKQKMKVIKNFLENDSTYEVSASQWKKSNFFETEKSTLKYITSIQPKRKSINKNRKSIRDSLNNRISIHNNDLQLIDIKNIPQAHHHKNKKTNEYFSMIKKQFQLKGKQNKIIDKNEDSFINKIEMKRQIKETEKFIELTVADMLMPVNSTRNSIYFDNEEDHKQQGIALFVKIILMEKDELGINKLYQKHQMVKKKKQNIQRKKVEKQHKFMSSRRNSKFQNNQITNLLRSSMMNHVSNPRSRRPRNIRQSVGVIIQNKTQQPKITRRPVYRQNQYISKIQKLIDYNYSKSQQMIRKFSSEIQNQSKQDLSKQAIKTIKNQWSLSQKYNKLGKTVAESSVNNQMYYY